MRTWKLLGPDGFYESPVPGTLGGHRRTKVYGRLDCPAALRAIARGGPYPRHRVFFASAEDAIAAGYRPCSVCRPDASSSSRSSGASMNDVSGSPKRGH